MRAIAITHRGIEDIAAKEIKELIGKEAEISETVISFDAEKEDLFLLCYKAQSLIKVLEFIDEVEIKELDDFKKLKIDFSFKGTFAVRCIRIGEHNFNSTDVEKNVGKLVYEKTKQKVDLANPDNLFFVYVYKNKAYFGKDHAGFDLSKREYKIFTGAKSLKGTIAYALVRIADYNESDVMIDPFSSSGEIAIEAALFATKTPVNYFNKEKLLFKRYEGFDFEKEDKKIRNVKGKIICSDPNMKNVKAAQKNAKIAGVDKSIQFSRIDIEWLDTKLNENEVGKIITRIPEVTKFQNEKNIVKLYDEFFYQVEFILKNKGRIAVLAKNTDLFKKSAKQFKVIHEREVWSGEEAFKVLVLEK